MEWWYEEDGGEGDEGEGLSESHDGNEPKSSESEMSSLAMGCESLALPQRQGRKAGFPRGSAISRCRSHAGFIFVRVPRPRARTLVPFPEVLSP